MRMKTPLLILAAAGLVGTASAQTGLPKNQTSNVPDSPKIHKTQVAPIPGFGSRVDASDNCADAPAVVDGDVVNFNTAGASNDFAASCGLSSASADVWVKVVATSSVRVTLSTCGLSAGDTVLAVTDGCGGGEVLCQDDSCGLQTQVSFLMDAGQTYYARIAGYNNGTPSGQLSVSIIPNVPGGSAADACEDAPLVGVGIHDFDTASATNDYAATCGASSASPDAWLKYTTGDTSEQVTATTCGLSGNDTVLTLVDGCGGNQLACIDDACGLQSTVSAIVGPNTTVWIRVAGYAGGTASGQVQISAVDVVPPPNDSCATAAELQVGVPTAFDSSFADSDGSASCGFGGDPGSASVWFKFTANRDGQAEVLTCGLVAFDTIISMYDSCDGTELGCNDDACGVQSAFFANVTNGQEYLVRVSGYGLARGAGQVQVNIGDPCETIRPSGAVDENEDCQSASETDTNGGCNIPGFPVELVEVDSVIWGNASTFFDANTGFDTRDTDWYEFTLDTDRDITITGTAGYDLRIFLLDTACPDVTIISTANSGRPCAEAVITASLTAGTYRVFAGTNFFAGLPCDGTVDTHYILTIGDPPAGCIADFNGDSFVDFFDYLDYVTCFEGEGCPAGRSADVNGDDFVDFFDYADYVDAFETGC